EEYKVKAIVDHKQENGQWWYYIKWKGCGPESNNWEPRQNLEHTRKILNIFHAKLLKMACDSTKGLKRGALS
ncbi:putative Transposon Tf2-1 polyprotein, partial [Rhizoctonia solani 123E]